MCCVTIPGTPTHQLKWNCNCYWYNDMDWRWSNLGRNMLLCNFMIWQKHDEPIVFMGIKWDFVICFITEVFSGWIRNKHRLRIKRYYTFCESDRESKLIGEVPVKYSALNCMFSLRYLEVEHSGWSSNCSLSLGLNTVHIDESAVRIAARL
jgi:hypothetical protein